MLDPGYKRLNGKTGIMGSRNTTFFGILIGLVILLTLFWVYISASNEASTLKGEVDNQKDHITKLKNEILDITVRLEKARSGESACQTLKSALEKKSDECLSEMDKLKSSAADLQSTVSEKEETIKSLKLTINEKTEQIEKDEMKKSAMIQAGAGQEAVIIKLNETVELMKKDLALKDDVIHDLKSKLNFSNDNSQLNQNNEELKFNETNINVNQITLPPVNKENENSGNVIPLPNKPDGLPHLSDLSVNDKIPKPDNLQMNLETNEENEPKNDDMEANEQEKMQNGIGNIVVRDAKARMKLNDQVEEEKNEDDKEELVDAIDFGGSV